MTYIDIQQNTLEWFDLRAGKVTSSKMATVMANFGKAFGDPAKKYAQEIALERVNGERLVIDSFTSSAMQRGSDLEPVACAEYERESMVEVKNGGFFVSDDGKKGDSPDGLIGEDGVLEIKCPLPDAHWKVIKDGTFSSQYKWQIHFHIWVTGRQYCDFVSFCPEFPEDKRLHVFRIERDETKILEMTVRLGKFEELVEENIALLK